MPKFLTTTIVTCPFLKMDGIYAKSNQSTPMSTFFANEDTQTDFSALDVLRNTAAPATSIDACTSDGFALNNQMRISGCGIILIGGEAFRWRPWLQEEKVGGTIAKGGTGDDAMTGKLLNAKKQWEVQEGAWGVLELVYPKPDLLIIGTGPHVTPIAPSVRKYLNSLGIRLEIQDTRNAAAQFNLLATERGVGQVAAALIPIGWTEGRQG
ncbi:Nn.00g010520.m01.CDS01 [Neocucurbitaria sp. VM-36]